jgi:hypothetical protein
MALPRAHPVHRQASGSGFIVSDTATTDEAQEDGNNRNDQQNMNQASQGVGGKQAQQPENDQQNRNGFQHFLSGGDNDRKGDAFSEATPLGFSQGSYF